MATISPVNKSLFISLAQKLIVIANARYRNEEKYLLEITNFLGVLDVIFSLEENKEIGDSVVLYLENMEYDAYVDLSDIISILHAELCLATIYGYSSDVILSYEECKAAFDKGFVYEHNNSSYMGCQKTMLVYLFARIMVNLVALYSRDGIMDLKKQAVEKVKLLSNIRYFTTVDFETGEELDKLLELNQKGLDMLNSSDKTEE